MITNAEHWKTAQDVAKLTKKKTLCSSAFNALREYRDAPCLTADERAEITALMESFRDKFEAIDEYAPLKKITAATSKVTTPITPKSQPSRADSIKNSFEAANKLLNGQDYFQNREFELNRIERGTIRVNTKGPGEWDICHAWDDDSQKMEYTVYWVIGGGLETPEDKTVSALESLLTTETAQ